MSGIPKILVSVSQLHGFCSFCYLIVPLRHLARLVVTGELLARVEAHTISALPQLSNLRAKRASRPRSAVPDANRGLVLNIGPRQGDARPRRARRGQGRRGTGDRRHPFDR
ncbi:hypothetical protein MPLB_1460026 [Mesorhizobium sp. ORS 3324]|nr:hypothetical protein MPLB_1460026 [Mesorhizobium sp. ORS 3324]